MLYKDNGCSSVSCFGVSLIQVAKRASAISFGLLQVKIGRNGEMHALYIWISKKSDFLDHKLPQVHWIFSRLWIPTRIPLTPKGS
jgi:hypothetical protein